MKKTYPSISFKIKKVKLLNNVFNIEFIVDELSFDHAKRRNIALEIQKYFKLLYSDFEFVANFESGVVFVEDEMEILKQNYKEDDVDIYEKRIKLLENHRKKCYNKTMLCIVCLNF